MADSNLDQEAFTYFEVWCYSHEVQAWIPLIVDQVCWRLDSKGASDAWREGLCEEGT